jgi:IclR family acetate operon transcriptional repressor
VQTTKLLALASRGGGMSPRERALPVMQELLERTDCQPPLGMTT